MLARFIEGGIVAEVCEVIHAQGGGGGACLIETPMIECLLVCIVSCWCLMILVPKQITIWVIITLACNYR